MRLDIELQPGACMHAHAHAHACESKKRGQGGIEPPTSPTLRENHATRPLALIGWGKAPPPGLEPGTYRLTAERSAN